MTTHRSTFSLTCLAALAASSAASAAPDPPKCLKDGGFQVVYADREDAVGQNILIQRLASGESRPCALSRRDGDYFVENDTVFTPKNKVDPASSDASDALYVLKLKGDVLAIDIGTGPDRNLMLYNLKTRQQFLNIGYDDTKPVDMAADRLTFTATLGDATPKNRSQYKKWNAMGLTPTLTRPARVFYASGHLGFFGPLSCEEGQ